MSWTRKWVVWPCLLLLYYRFDCFVGEESKPLDYEIWLEFLLRCLLSEPIRKLVLLMKWDYCWEVRDLDVYWLAIGDVGLVPGQLSYQCLSLLQDLWKCLPGYLRLRTLLICHLLEIDSPLCRKILKTCELYDSTLPHMFDCVRSSLTSEIQFFHSSSRIL